MAFAVKVTVRMEQSNMGTDKTLEEVQAEMDANQSVGSALLQLGLATAANGEALRVRGFEGIADKCVELCEAIGEAIAKQADDYIALIKQVGVIESQIANLEAAFSAEPEADDPDAH